MAVVLEAEGIVVIEEGRAAGRRRRRRREEGRFKQSSRGGAQ